tara:strand:- start:224 stop:397 length:174 start_codon:yes stop_codon:yes gene_type:complete
MGLQRQHKFIDSTNNEIVYHLIEYTDESDYDAKVLAVIDSHKEVAVFEDTGEYRQIS